MSNTNYYYTVTKEDETHRYEDKYIVEGYDVDGDGIIDYRPVDLIMITKDMKLTAIWKFDLSYTYVK